MDKYRCIKDWNDVKTGDIVSVEIGIQVHITHNKATHCTDEFILTMHFEKEE